MSSPAAKVKGSARERILEVATELFFQKGFRATGINEVIEKSGVAKATFYNHFPTKDDLCREYLIGLREGEERYLDNSIAAAKGPLNRFLAPIRSVGPWLEDNKFRGCPFVNIAAEVPDHKSPLRKEGIKVYDAARARIESVSQELLESDPDQYGHLDWKQLSNDYMLLFTGTISLADIYHDIWPVEQAEKAVKRLIGK